MICEADLQEIAPDSSTCSASSVHVQTGVPIPKTVRVRNFSPDEWEAFVEEWASALKSNYLKVRRFGGSGDLGVDIAGFCTDQGFLGAWDNYQCKRYGQPLAPGDIWVEIGKIIYYSQLGEYVPPRKHYFLCSRDIGTSLEKLLNNPSELKKKSRENWEKHCLNGITSTVEVPLTDTLAVWFDAFDFTIFSSRSHVELIEAHSKTGFHAVRFGGGLPPRPNVGNPPEALEESESRYIRQLLDAYSHHLGISLPHPTDLDVHKVLKRDYLRQRERFYHAEALRNFARNTVPEGTFDALQDEIYHGVIDVCESTHADGFARMKATVAHAPSVAATANHLVSATKTQDRQGICHQLANDNRLTWVPESD